MEKHVTLSKIVIASLLAVASFSASADITILGGSLFVNTTGNVTATFLGSDAGYTDLLIFDPLGQNRTLFNGHKTALHTTIDLGSFSQGTELRFQLHVNNTGENFFTGAASANSDNVFHASAVLDNNHQAIVGFEDLRGGGDRDYNDLQFRVTNVTNVSAVPEPSTWGMLIGGLGLLSFMTRGRKKAKRVS
jgi:hypothetical protein